MNVLASTFGRPPRARRTEVSQQVRGLRALDLNARKLLRGHVHCASKEVTAARFGCHRSLSCGVAQHLSQKNEDRLINANFADNIRVFGVVDGHGGDACASFVARELPIAIFEGAQRLGCDKAALSDERWGEALEYAFDAVAKAWDGLGVVSSGAVVSLAVVSGNHCLIAHAGDCKVVASTPHGSFVELTRDHRCSDPEEAQRVEELGGVVVNGRVEGQLMPSRAFGDVDLRTRATGVLLDCISPEPEICYHHFDESGEGFMILASDGLFDVLKVKGVIDKVRSCLKETRDPELAAKCLVDIASKRSKDDISVVILHHQFSA